MDTQQEYVNQGFNLPHDVLELPSKGRFYKNKKKSIKVGYLTATDENILASLNSGADIINNLIRTKIYEPDVHVDSLLEGDIEAILIFLRNTAFGTEYNFTLVDPKDNKKFKTTVHLDELDIKKPIMEPDEDGLFTIKLPKSGQTVKCRLLTQGDHNELKKMEEAYGKGITAPIVTNRLQKEIVSVDGNEDKNEITKFIQLLPIADSKHIRKTLSQCEPRLDLNREVVAPSGEKVNVRIAFGAEFFRPFF